MIGGNKRPPVSGKTFETINPAYGEVLALVPACDSADVDAEVAAARKAFETGTWSQTHPSERKAVLAKLADPIMENLTELAVIEALDAGKPIAVCVEIDIFETPTAE